MKITGYLGLGSNLGDREANLLEARDRIRALGVSITRASSIYETEPVGYADQGWFLNQVIEIIITPETQIGAETEPHIGLKEQAGDNADDSLRCQAIGLLQAVLRIEEEMGRERPFVNAPRVIDIDVLLLGDFVMTTTITNLSRGENAVRADLIVPHPRLHLRRFVLEPLCEIAPDLLFPNTHKRIRDLLAESTDTSLVRLYRRVG